jgi:hypothetical protein
VVTVITTAEAVESLSGLVGFGENAHDPVNSGVAVQLNVTALLYAAPMGATLKLYVIDCPAVMVWLAVEGLATIS